MYVPAGQNEADGVGGGGGVRGKQDWERERARADERRGKESERICRVRKTGRVVFGHSLHTQNQNGGMYM